MTNIIFTAVFVFAWGYFSGKLFKGMNPFKVFIGGVALLFGYAILNDIGNPYYGVPFFCGLLYNLGNPFAGIGGFVDRFQMNLDLKRANKRREQRFNAEFNNESKDQQAKTQREQNTRWRNQDNKHAEREEHIRREKDDLEREKERFRQEQKNKSQNNQRDSSNKKSSAQERKKQEPKDSRTPEEILGLKPNSYTLADLKKAKKVKSNAFHSDKLKDVPEALRLAMQEEQKKVNSAFEKLKSRL